MRRWCLMLPLLLAACDGGARPMPPATLIVEAPTLISSFAVDDRFVYWTDGQGGEASFRARVMRAPLAGGVPEVLSEERFNSADLFSGADTLYWVDRGDLASCSRLVAMDKASGAIVELSAALPTACLFHPVDEYEGKLLAVADDPDDGTELGQLYRFDPRGSSPPEAVTRFAATVSPAAGARRTGPSLYLGQLDRCVLRVFRADLESNSQAPALTWELENTSGFAADTESLYWVDQRYADRSELHRRALQGDASDEILASFEGGIGGEPILDGDHLWLLAGGYVRVALEGGQVDRFEAPYQLTLRPQVRPEGLYVVDGARLYRQARP